MTEKLKPVAFLDIDNTLVDGYIVFPLTEFLERKKLLTPGTSQRLQNIGKTVKDYEQFALGLLEEWSQGSSEQNVAGTAQIAAEFIRSQISFRPFVSELIHLLKPNYDVFLVTGEVDYVGHAVANIIGANSAISSRFEQQDGYFTGNLESPLAFRKQKTDAISNIFAAGHNFERSIALGDSDADIAMLEMVDIKGCVNPKPNTEIYSRSICPADGWYRMYPYEVISKLKWLGVRS